MKLKIFRFLLISYSFLILTCDKIINLELEDFSGITETDGYGNVIGNTDYRDWSGSGSETYVTTYVDKNIMISPDTIFSDNFSTNKNLSIFNFSNEEIFVKASIDSPFTLNPESTVIQPNLNGYINVGIKHIIDTLDLFQDIIVLISSLGDTILSNVKAYYESAPVACVPIYSYTFFFAAYPNPASDLVVLNFILDSKEVDVKLKIINKDGDIIKTLLDTLCKYGVNSIYWDLTDNYGNRVEPDLYRVIFKTDYYEVFGDIRVIE